MLQDVDEPAQRVPDVETAHAPGLACTRSLARSLVRGARPHQGHPPRSRCPALASPNRLRLRRLPEVPSARARHDPPMIHYDFKAEDVGVEMSGFRHVGRGIVGDDDLVNHVRMLPASAPFTMSLMVLFVFSI